MERQVSILDGGTFVVSDLRGNIEHSVSRPLGLFHLDTRFLSEWILTIDGVVPAALSTDDVQYFQAQFFLVPRPAAMYVQSTLSIVRSRFAGDGFHEDLLLMNHGKDPVDLEVRIQAAADFADLFEVKDMLPKKGERYHRIEDNRLVLGYRRERFVRETWISASQPAQIDPDGLTFRASIAPHGRWSTCLDVVAAIDGLEERHTRVKYAHGERHARPNIGISLESWMDHAPRLVTSNETLARTYERSLIDLAALRFFSKLMPDAAIPAAGLPWFMAAFGRDSIITSLQALPFVPELSRSTLRYLARRQGSRRDDFRDEEPGKILHEVRWGELTAFEERPHSPYFGAADSTPLFLILLDEYERWTGDAELVLSMEHTARAALRWIDQWGDRDGDGYVEYDTRNPETGLENQCWKDSWDAIVFHDGSLAPRPLACCEIQGYVYDAKVRCARLARELWRDPELAARLERDAAELKRRFNQDFWLDDRGFFALALDGRKRPVDSLTSNIGHLLWSGIVETSKAERVVEHLLGPHLFSGWGVRTLADDEGGYNPIGYHVGTVWPHDNSLIALGLRRYGFSVEAGRIATGNLAAAPFFHYRLPEAFAGYPRELTRFPVEYPTACSPQAWAAGAPLLFLRAVLGLEPMGNRLFVDPAVPAELGEIRLLDIPGRWGRSDAFGRARPESGLRAA
ncbi:amylo-alpha-1,6-glucosidase [Sorangium cellulosum]|uniref:Amylo-alpha-1,6-glucosidase n=1 Tax=Sorangium cellulosum TaxID=56 RepID=A0A150RDD0_SORCE|nr:amylo-alpha-1,6-glucosidase [Sorangium cellulosum]KYF86948.1 amylo-alpha-1,6-glucosidase [Sorangium cellulosum]